MNKKQLKRNRATEQTLKLKLIEINWWYFNKRRGGKLPLRPWKNSKPAGGFVPSAVATGKRWSGETRELRVPLVLMSAQRNSKWAHRFAKWAYRMNFFPQWLSYPYFLPNAIPLFNSTKSLSLIPMNFSLSSITHL